MHGRCHFCFLAYLDPKSNCGIEYLVPPYKATPYQERLSDFRYIKIVNFYCLRCLPLFIWRLFHSRRGRQLHCRHFEYSSFIFVVFCWLYTFPIYFPNMIAESGTNLKWAEILLRRSSTWFVNFFSFGKWLPVCRSVSSFLIGWNFKYLALRNHCVKCIITW